MQTGKAAVNHISLVLLAVMILSLELKADDTKTFISHVTD